MARRVTHADRLQAHFYWWLDRIGARVEYDRREADQFGGGWAGVLNMEGEKNLGIVCLRHRIRNSVEYFVALHEIGHLVHHSGPRGFRFEDTPILTSEWWAWRWALDNACIKPSRAVWADIANCMTNYANQYVHDKRVTQDRRFYGLLGDARERR